MRHSHDYCRVCDVRVKPKWTAQNEDKYNYISTFDGPFCDRCFFFMERIEVLSDRVVILENAALKEMVASTKR